MQVQPNSTIYLLAGVPVDKGYNYSLHFESAAVQEATMRRFIMSNGTFTRQQYTRQEKGKLKVAVCSDDVINCNYIMFKNDGLLNTTHRYKNKWFYAFANVEYLNENACIINFEIDDVQTWMFDYEFEECFVEREHAITDNVGDNLQPEPIDTGELVVTRKYESSFNAQTEYMLGAIITNKPLNTPEHPDKIYIKSEDYFLAQPFSFDVFPTFSPTVYEDTSAYAADTSSGISNGLYIYSGLVLDNKSWTDFFKSRTNVYNIYNAEGTNTNIPTPSITPPILTLGLLINAIVDNQITGANFSDDLNLSENNIVACYQYPAGFNLKSAESAAISEGFKKGIALFTNQIGGGNTPFNPYSTSYTPKNNKLKTAPFAKMYVTTEAGSSGEYRFEFFDKTNNEPVITWNKISTYFGQPSACFVPTHYKGKERDYDNAVITSPYPTPIYAGNAFQAWWQGNKNSFILGTITNALSMGLAGAMSFSAVGSSGKHTGIGAGIGNVLHGAGAIGGSIGTLADKSNIPPNTYYQAQNEALNVGTNRIKFIIYFLCVTPEYARKIDGFFTKYGYATNELKVPNLQRGHAKRQWWNYLKVNSCMLHGILPADVEQHLEQIYERGITMWTYDVNAIGTGGNVGNYDRANPVVTPT